jgi:uncharacterized protein (TIGR03437 family)
MSSTEVGIVEKFLISGFRERLSWISTLLIAAALGMPVIAEGQISSKAYRGLGQSDLVRNGINRVQGVELSGPLGLAIDSRNGVVRLYVADTGNHRVLGWADARSYQAGDPPALVLGQASFEGSAPVGIGSGGFRSPAGIAVDPLTGNVYVADSGNNRVLRFADPFNNPSRVEPEAVYGQPDITTVAANGSGNQRSTLRNPRGVAVDNAGNLWVADTGNHRILRYSAGVLDSSSPAPDIVLGQRDLNGTGSNRSGADITGAGFNSPSALFFSANNDLYISDSLNARVLQFSAPFLPESSAKAVFPMPVTDGLTAGPGGLSVFEARLYVAVPAEHRTLVFSTATADSAVPVSVLGQPDLNSREPNAGVHPRAAAFSLAQPMDVKVDPNGGVYIADAGNHRVVGFSSGSRSADRVWGQADFTANGLNQVDATGLNSPYKVVVDYSRTPFPLYVSDTNNHRVLIWRDSTRFRTGDPADAVIGQPDMRTAIPNYDGTGRRPAQSSLSSPEGIAVDSQGNLYVADTGNNRVLRFPRPLDQSSPISADLVLGQSDFNTGTAASTGPGSFRSPTAVAVGPDGGIFVSDTGNNRVLEFAAGASTNAAAIRAFGQPNFASSTGPRAVSAQTLTEPKGLAVDQAFNLYVADSAANRVLVYANTRDAASASNAAAIVIGSDAFNAVRTGSSRTRIEGPSDVSLDSLGRIYVADARNNRVLIFPSVIFLPITDGAALAVAGQNDFEGKAGNWNSQEGMGSPESLLQPTGIFIDRKDTLYVADSGNQRILHFLKAAKISHGAFEQASALGKGALVTIAGEGLAENDNSSQAPLPQSLGGREVVVNDMVRSPLLSVSPQAISLQLPTTTPAGSPRLAVRDAETAELIAGATVPVATYAPGLFAKVLNQDGTTNAETSPAAKGSTIRLMGTGQGPVSPSLTDGEAAQDDSVKTIAVPTSDGSACLTRQPSVCVAIGNTFGEVRFSGLAPGMVGVWQLDVRIPETAATGTLALRAVINAVPSNIINVAVR